ncbi:beta-alanyl-bioamine nonribosomal peptide synthetase ebony-like [Artemia franciscana]|uniref:beta-alanyl-bioamine nonribosomal peptide synthetase ebony-like n=1 Tax=Artemia franciscana TaxID=6661 RepID=UPI0032D9B761
MDEITILHGFDSQFLDYGSVIDIFEETARRNSEKTALIFAGEEFSYSDLCNRADKVASVLSVLKLSKKPNSDNDWLVAVSFPPSVDLIATLIGIWKSGSAYVPIEPSFPETRISHILNDSQPFCILKTGDQPALSSVAESLQITVVEIDLDGNTNKTTKTDTGIREDQTGIVLYTSGSTGTPKGVRIPFRAIIARLAWQWRVFPYKCDDVCCFKTALTFVDSVSEIFAPLLKAIPVVIIPKEVVKDPEELVSILQKHSVSRIVLVPTLLRNILAVLEDSSALEKLSFWVCSGETLSLELVKDFFNMFPSKYTLCNFYGSTEVMGDVTYLTMKSWEEASGSLVARKVPIGIAVDNCKIYLMDQNYHLVKTGEQGEIYIAGAHVALGYVGAKGSDRFIKNPYATSKDFGLLYKTGDYGKIVNGHLSYEGRSDSQIKVRGHRVDLIEVDGVIRSISYVESSIVLCYNPGQIDQEILAFVALRDEHRSEQLVLDVKKLLPTYMVPKVIQVASLPLLVNGKVDRQTLLKEYENSLKCEDNRSLSISVEGLPKCQQLMATRILQTIATCLNLVENRTNLTLDHNFFDIGGNSLNAVAVVMKLKDQGFNIKIGDFLRSKSLKQLLEIMDPSKPIRHVKSFELGLGPHLYSPETINGSHREFVVDLLAKSFSTKGDLEKLLNVSYHEFYDMADRLFPDISKSKTCFVMKNLSGDIVAAAINFDAYNEPSLTSKSQLRYILELLDTVEEEIRDGKIPSGRGKALHSVLMGTDIALPSSENLYLIQLMEEHNIDIARQNGFTCLFTTNTSAATRDICDDVLNYEVLVERPVYNYVASDGTMPFTKADPEQKVVVTRKWL